jgi:hypothetical protein
MPNCVVTASMPSSYRSSICMISSSSFGRPRLLFGRHNKSSRPNHIIHTDIARNRTLHQIQNSPHFILTLPTHHTTTTTTTIHILIYSSVHNNSRGYTVVPGRTQCRPVHAISIKNDVSKRIDDATTTTDIDTFWRTVKVRCTIDGVWGARSIELFETRLNDLSFSHCMISN